MRKKIQYNPTNIFKVLGNRKIQKQNPSLFKK
jgi:hypothetical protein